MERALAYDRHTGRYSADLAAAFARFASVAPGMRTLDVGCGPGALAVELGRIVAAPQVAAVDPSQDYVDVCRLRAPGADVLQAAAEELPFEDGSFDAVLAQLVVQVLDDAPRATREMVRVTRSGGVVAACVWDFERGMPLLAAYWGAAELIDPGRARQAGANDTSQWCTPEGLRALWSEAGLERVYVGELSATAEYDGLEDAWWSFTAGVSPSGKFYRSLNNAKRAALREEFWRRLGAPDGQFILTARAWAVRGWAPGRVTVGHPRQGRAATYAQPGGRARAWGEDGAAPSRCFER